MGTQGSYDGWHPSGGSAGGGSGGGQVVAQVPAVARVPAVEVPVGVPVEVEQAQCVVVVGTGVLLGDGVDEDGDDAEVAVAVVVSSVSAVLASRATHEPSRNSEPNSAPTPVRTGINHGRLPDPGPGPGAEGGGAEGTASGLSGEDGSVPPQELEQLCGLESGPPAWPRSTPNSHRPGCRRYVGPPRSRRNQIDHLRLRKVSKNRGHFPQVDAAIKLFSLALGNVNPPDSVVTVSTGTASVVTVSTGTASVVLSEHRSRCRR